MKCMYYSNVTYNYDDLRKILFSKINERNNRDKVCLFLTILIHISAG